MKKLLIFLSLSLPSLVGADHKNNEIKVFVEKLEKMADTACKLTLKEAMQLQQTRNRYSVDEKCMLFMEFLDLFQYMKDRANQKADFSLSLYNKSSISNDEE